MALLHDASIAALGVCVTASDFAVSSVVLPPRSCVDDKEAPRTSPSLPSFLVLDCTVTEADVSSLCALALNSSERFALPMEALRPSVADFRARLDFEGGEGWRNSAPLLGSSFLSKESLRFVFSCRSFCLCICICIFIRICT